MTRGRREGAELSAEGRERLEARKKLWKNAIRTGTVSRNEIREVCFDPEAQELLEMSLLLARIKITE